MFRSFGANLQNRNENEKKRNPSHNLQYFYYFSNEFVIQMDLDIVEEPIVIENEFGDDIEMI